MLIRIVELARTLPTDSGESTRQQFKLTSSDAVSCETSVALIVAQRIG